MRHGGLDCVCVGLMIWSDINRWEIKVYGGYVM